MRKILLVFLISLCAVGAHAVKAWPFPVEVRQADGSWLTIVQYGDEDFHYCMTTDGVLVVEHAKRRKRELVEAVKQIRQSGCPVIGCIINRVSVRTRSERKYYKNHYYSYTHYAKNGVNGGYGYGYKRDSQE